MPRFVSAVATPHELATLVAKTVLADEESGRNAVDAAVTASLLLSVLLPHACGPGGDLFALVWDGGQLHALDASGGAPAAATPEAITALTGRHAIDPFGPHAVTVPGAVDGWSTLLERFGTVSFSEAAYNAIGQARLGVDVPERGLAPFARGRERFGHRSGWAGVYGRVPETRHLLQPRLGRLFELLADEGRDAFYRGQVAHDIVATLRREEGLLRTDDLAGHRSRWVTPLRAPYRDVEVVELPPPTQGVSALEALRIVDAAGPLPPDGDARLHLLVEAAKAALADRGEHVGDPEAMRLDPEELLADGWVRRRLDVIDPDRASAPPPARPLPGGTVALCAADERGQMVCIVQSNFMPFGSGIVVPEWGLVLHNRGAFFRLDPDHPDAIGPGKRPLHTLIPAAVLRDGRPQLVLGTMGGDAQAQIHLQVITRFVDDGVPLHDALASPRWTVDPWLWSVSAEEGFPAGTVDALRRRGHEVTVGGPDDAFGHANAIAVVDDGYVAASDPRTFGAADGHDDGH